MRGSAALSVLVLMLASAFPVGAEGLAINRPYDNPDVTQWRGVFERDGREVWDRRVDILRELQLRPGERIADVGAGTGFFSLMMAREVGPDGRVFAVDIARNFVDAAVERARGQGLDNVTGVVNDQHGVGLPPASVDRVFISDTYHHFEYPRAMLDSIHAALDRDGELVVIDFKRIPGVSHPWVLQHVRAGEGQVRGEIEAAGFELVGRPDFMQTQYFLRFRKRAGERRSD
ncbi:MAG: methyltransferase domain-containing protein [Gammaproteobacteria bacterium]|nr:methyltransferase domain-containing protein [Gammaproteobacteria bacterium]